MSGLRECPFCGSHNEKPINHAEDCFIRMYAENVDEMNERKSRLHDRESMLTAWNTRAERMCTKVPGKMHYGERRPKCSECGYGLGDKRWAYCPNCGAKVTEASS